MAGVEGISEVKIYKLDVQENMAPPEEEPPREEEAQLTLLKPGEPVGIGGMKFKPLDGLYARTHYSPIERMQNWGKWNIIKNVTLYTIGKMYQGIGSFLDIRI